MVVSDQRWIWRWAASASLANCITVLKNLAD